MSDPKNTISFIENILSIPKNILKHENNLALPELLLSHISCKNNFHLKKAVYCLDNPEFNCLKGVVGFDAKTTDNCSLFQSLIESSNIEEEKLQALINCDFNKSIKQIYQPSIFALEKDHSDEIKKLACSALGTDNPLIFSWTAKNGNHGLFFCEPVEKENLESKQNFLEYAVSLLSMLHF